MNSKKITAFLLSTAMMVSYVPAFAFADDSEPSEGTASVNIAEPAGEDLSGGEHPMQSTQLN